MWHHEAIIIYKQTPYVQSETVNVCSFTVARWDLQQLKSETKILSTFHLTFSLSWSSPQCGSVSVCEALNGLIWANINYTNPRHLESLWQCFQCRRSLWLQFSPQQWSSVMSAANMQMSYWLPLKKHHLIYRNTQSVVVFKETLWSKSR